MLDNVRYIELKSGYADDGPAWIGRVKLSKSGRTLYFNGLALQKWYADRWADVETGLRYWVSRLKKNGCDRHWAGRGKVAIDRRLVEDYLRYTGEKNAGREPLYRCRSGGRLSRRALLSVLQRAQSAVSAPFSSSQGNT